MAAIVEASRDAPSSPILEIEDVLEEFDASPRRLAAGKTNKHKKGRKEAMAAKMREIYQRRLDESLQQASIEKRQAVEEAHRHAVDCAEADHQREIDELQDRMDRAKHAAVAAHLAEAEVAKALAVEHAVRAARVDLKGEYDLKTAEMTHKTRNYFQRKFEREHAKLQAELDRQIKDERAKGAEESLERLRAQLDTLRHEQAAATAERAAAVSAAEAAALAHAQELHEMAIRSMQQETKEQRRAVANALSQAEAERTAALANAQQQIENIQAEALRAQTQFEFEREVLRNEHTAAMRDAEEKWEARVLELTEELDQQSHESGLRMEAALSDQASQLENAYASALAEAESAANQRLASAQKDNEAIMLMYRSEAAARKRNHNRLVELQGNIQVFCRFRPILPREREMNGDGNHDDGTSVEFPGEGVVKVAVPTSNKTGRSSTSRFEFDKAFDPTATQAEVFTAVEPLVVSALDGYNVTIFAYGQTGSGKTHTMDGTLDDPGVNRRAVEALFESIAEREAVVAFTVMVSILEVYNEDLRDLLDPAGLVVSGAANGACSAAISPNGSANAPHPHGSRGSFCSGTHHASPTTPPPSKLEIRQDGNSGHEIRGLTKRPVNNVHEVLALLEVGSANRTVGRHNMNEHSSRSHLVLTLYVVGSAIEDGGVVRSKVHLIDLAGSERVSKTDATGATLKEAQNINKSLSTLGDVISAVGKRASHVPFRNSKLTFFLQDSFTNGAKVQMFVNCSPAVVNLSESLTSLNFARRCRAVELGSARKNADSAEVVKLRRQIRQLQEDLAMIASAAEEDEADAALGRSNGSDGGGGGGGNGNSSGAHPGSTSPSSAPSPRRSKTLAPRSSRTTAGTSTLSRAPSAGVSSRRSTTNQPGSSRPSAVASRPSRFSRDRDPRR